MTPPVPGSVVLHRYRYADPPTPWAECIGECGAHEHATYVPLAALEEARAELKKPCKECGCDHR